MIEDLINQYNALRERGEAVGYGEESVNIPYAVRLDDEGTVVHIDTLGDTTQKRITNYLIVPLHGGRTGSKPKGMPLSIFWEILRRIPIKPRRALKRKRRSISTSSKMWMIPLRVPL